MKTQMIILCSLTLMLLLAGCAQSGPPTGYAAYGGQNYGGQQAHNNNYYVGGGCGVATEVGYDQTADVLSSATSAA